MPFYIVVEAVRQLFALLLQFIDIKGVDVVKEAAIGSLTSTLIEKPQVLEEHTGALISRLLANATVSKANGVANPPPNVRVAALKCLHLVAEKFKEDNILRYRREVVRRLIAALDDGKREVRSAAVKCRAKWLEADEPDDE